MDLKTLFSARLFVELKRSILSIATFDFEKVLLGNLFLE